MHRSFTSLAVASADDLVYGQAPYPVRTRSGMEIGGGTLYPELNFTLPTMAINGETMPEIRRHYAEATAAAARRAAELDAPGLVVEFETLPPMVENPDWGIELVRIMLEALGAEEARSGLKTAVRFTPNDLREMHRPPVMRSGPLLDAMMESFDRAAEAGADFLSIESVGGKEVSDDSLTQGDLPGILFALGVLGVRDMAFLWPLIRSTADRHGVQAAGDTACGFANTAMVLAERNYIPRVFAAVVRAVSAVRSLVAYTCGAVGPGKDCGYENVYLKAITGCPMSMEGRTAACAHLSPVGNIAAAMADLWSNESVQNVRLLAAMAPTCYLEQLVYDARLHNTAAASGGRKVLRDWLVQSDAPLDPQAFVLAPESVMAVAKAIVDAGDLGYAASCAAARTAIALLRSGETEGRVRIPAREMPWLDRMEEDLDELPEDEDAFVGRMMSRVDTDRFRPSEYGLQG